MTKPLVSVLLVDDDEEDAFLTRELLGDVTNFKCAVSVVNNASAAINEIVKGTYDVCLLDYRLGGQTGLEVLASATMHGSDVPCIMLTGQDDEEIDSAALAAGAVDYLVKGSFDGETLARTIRYALRNADALRSLKISEQRFRSVVDSAIDAILVVSDNGIVQSWNPQALKLFGRDSSALGTIQFAELFKDELGSNAVTDLVAGLRRIQQIEDEQAFDLEAETPKGLLVPCEVTMASWQSVDGKQWTAIVRDVTERKAMEDRLVHQAFHDPLTKLANRSLFRNRVEHGVTRLSRTAGFVGVLFCDLDDFKRINDTLGHAAGDELLVAVAQRLQGCIRRTDTAARLGGDEFAILVEDANDTEDILKVAAATLRAFNQPFMIADREVVVKASIGIAISGETDNDAEVLLRNADVAMYAAKHSGKDRYTVFEGSMHRELMYRLQLEGDLRKAVEQEEITVRYQPIVHLGIASNAPLRGFEALARWEHPTLGTISPVTFIPLAEELGLIPEIGRQVLRRSCNQLKAWQDETGLHELIVSVNISVLQLEDDSMHNVVAKELELSGLEASKLVLEITESAMAQDPTLTSARLALVNELGVKLAIDDFGTGYSSLSYLRDLPVDILKIDRSFVNQMSDRGGAGEKLVRAIVAMAHSLGLTIVAEGVETEEQQRTLTELGCAFAQGNLFALPLLPSEALAFIGSHQASTPVPV